MNDNLLIVGIFICIGVFFIVVYGLYNDTARQAAERDAAERKRVFQNFRSGIEKKITKRESYF